MSIANMSQQKTLFRSLLLFVAFGYVTGCSNPDNPDDSGYVDLPPIQVREGDGLPLELPPDLVWVTNDEDPEFASPDAIRGGMFRTWMLSFPLTLRLVGPDSNGAFAGVMRANQFGPISYHPQTGRPIPVLATHWAFGLDGRSIFYRINPKAKWSDGFPVTADDFVFSVQFHRSEQIVGPWYNNYYTERIRDVRKYDSHIYGIQGADAKPPEEMHANYAIGPRPKHFHKMSDRWVEEYNWKPDPTTGPYHVGKVVKGKYVDLVRTENWWGDDLRYMRNRFNPQTIRYRVIRDQNTAWQHFLKGEIDTFSLTIPEYWHDKAQHEVFRDGYVAKYWFYNQLPQPSTGISLNTADPLLSDINIRLGIAHSINLQRVIDTILRGDYERLETFNLGFGEYDNTSIQPRKFDIKKANEYFEAAGFDKRDSSGIRIRTNEDGSVRRLSFRVTYGRPLHTPRLVVIQEEAKKTGLELQLQLLDSAASFKQMREKKHQLAWMGWASSGIAPTYWEFFHSVNANVTQSNNLTNHANPAMDELIMQYRHSGDRRERVALAHLLEQMVHDAAVVIPRTKVPFTREAAWRWVELPEWRGTRHSNALFNSQAPSQMYSGGGLFWINEEKKKEVLNAKKEGRRLDEIVVIDETYRN
ncbi:MAG: extracellular solute-binding protein [Gammaproteobacteria bacterium]|nr:extracellular solute-binding protein [Gammaproteobacteria bacterium]